MNFGSAAATKVLELSVLEAVLLMLLWLALASIALVPYLRAERRYRAMVARNPGALTSAKRLIDIRQSDPALERARGLAIRAGVFGLVLIVALMPFACALPVR